MVLEFGHFGGDIDVFNERFRKVPTGEAEAGLRRAFEDQIFQLLFGEQTVVDGIVDLIADNEVIVAAGGGFPGFAISFLGGLFMLVVADGDGAEIAGRIEAFATFVKIELVFEERHDVADEDVLPHTPVFDELDEGHIPAVAQRPGHQSQAGAGLTLALAGIDHDY